MNSEAMNWKPLALLCVAFFMAMLDSSIVLVALPSIDADLAFSTASLQWVMSAYMLAFGGLLLLGGRLADVLGQRRMFVLGVWLFGAASLGAGMAASVPALIAARVVQGIAAAVMTPSAQSILMTTYREGAERNRALGFWTSTGAIGGTIGWLIGGPITDLVGWEGIFLLNVPVAIAVGLLGPSLLEEHRSAETRRRFDVAGALTITAALVALVYAVVEAPQAGWTDLRTLGLLASSALLVGAFGAIESRSAAPLAPLAVLRSRSLAGGNLLLLALGMMAFGMPFVLTQYAQQVLDWSPVHFGLGFVVSPVLVVVGSAVGQALSTRGAVRSAALAGMALCGLGCLLLTSVAVGSGYLGAMLVPLIVFGLGIGFAYVAGSIASLTGVAESDAGLASGLNNASFQIGGAIGVAILSSVAAAGAGGLDTPAALTSGYTAAFGVAVAFAVVGVAAAVALLRRPAAAGSSAATAEPVSA